MSCEICGRANCTKSFHSLEEQEAFDDVAYNIKARAIRIMHDIVDSIDGEWILNDDGESVYMIELDLALKAIEEADL